MGMPPRADREAALDTELLRELDALRRRLEIRARSRGVGDRAAKRRGGASEFIEHRGYSPLDDLRRVDWAAYARTGDPVVKVFRAEEDVVIRVLCDASASLGFGDPRKVEMARKIAAAIGYLALSRGETAEIYETKDGETIARGASRGRAGALSFVRRAAGVEWSGTTNLGRAIETLAGKTKRPGMIALVSDFWDEGDIPRALSRAAALGHDVALVHIVAPEDTEPNVFGDVTLEDAETGAVVELTVDETTLRAYRERFETHCRNLRGAAKKLEGSYVRARTDENLLDVMRRFVARSID